MTSVEKSAGTVDEALDAALAELGATRDQVEVEILQEPSRSFLGILGHSEAKVRVALRESIGQKAHHYLAEMISRMDVPARVELLREDPEEVTLDIQGSDLGILIGKHGQTLGALQLLVALMANKGQQERKRILLDAEGYRARREQALRTMAQNAARKAKHAGREVTLDDLAPSERRIIHTTLADEEGVTTRSIGEDPYRKVIISPTAGQGSEREAAPGPHREQAPQEPPSPQEPAPPEEPPEAESAGP